MPNETREPRVPKPAVRSVPTVRWHGVYPAIVQDNADPDALGRVKVRLPWAPDTGGISGIQKGQQYEAWARVATMAAGANRGSWFIPEVDDEVLVAFEAGHPSRPVVVGALWNGQDTPPVHNLTTNDVKVLRTRAGSEVRFNDASGGETVEIRTAAGQSVTLTAPEGGKVEIADGNGNRVTLRASGITLHAAANLKIEASAMTVSAATVALDAGLVTCSGVVKTDTLIANSVVSSSYTPGAGNIW